MKIGLIMLVPGQRRPAGIDVGAQRPRRVSSLSVSPKSTSAKPSRPPIPTLTDDSRLRTAMRCRWGQHGLAARDRGSKKAVWQ